MFDNLITNLEPAFEKDLPGRVIQYQMAHQVRQIKMKQLIPPADVRHAAVLALLYPKNQDVYFTLIRRTNHGTHSGQVAFPGGGVEDQDETLEHTALREAEEEVGIRPEQVQVLGELTELYIPVSNRMVNPFLAYSTVPPKYVIQESEVQYVIEAPLNHLLDAQRIKETDLKVSQGFTLKDVPYFDIDGHVVWGATAMMLNEVKFLAEQALNPV